MKFDRKNVLTLLSLAVVAVCALRAVASGPLLNLGVSAGLSNGWVRSISQDGEGYIWVATNDGLNRFDGKRFVNYNTFNSGLTGNELNSVIYTELDPDGLYIATQRRGLCRYDRRMGLIGKAADVPVRSEAITDMCLALDGALWMSHYHFGVQYYNPQTGESKVFDFDQLPEPPRQTWTVAQGHDGRVYAGHMEYGLTVLDPVTQKVRNYRYTGRPDGLPGHSVLSVCVDRTGTVWVGTERGAALFNPDTGGFVQFLHRDDRSGTIAPGRVYSICQMNNDEIWFATSQGGVSVLDAKSCTYGDISNARFTTLPVDGSPGGTSSPYIYKLFQDSFGNIWLGHFRSGLDLIDHLAPVFERAPYLSSGPRATTYRPVWSCAATVNGTELWLGGENELVRYSKGDITPVSLPGSQLHTRTSINAITVDAAGRVWAGTSDRGVLIYTPSTKQFTSIEGINSEVRTFCQRPDNTMLVGTLEGVYVCKDGKALPLEAVNDKLKDHYITSLVVDRHGRLWVGTYGRGLAVFGADGKLLDDYEMSKGFISNAVNDIICDSRGSVWVATRQGLATFAAGKGKPDGFETVKALDESGVTHVMALTEGPQGNVWLSTNKGVVRIDRNTRQVSVFYDDMKDVPLNSFFEGGVTTDSEGRIYFASNNGLISMNPLSLAADPEMPAPVLTGLNVLTEGSDQRETIVPVHVSDGRIKLHPDQNTFTISFNILDHASAQRCDFAFNMQGLNDVWTENPPGNMAVFRNLSPGTYKFRVRVRPKGQQWGAPVTIVTITVMPPFYLTWWAKLLYLVLGIGAILYVGFYYKRRVDQKQRLATQVAEVENRQKLNEERLRFYTNITHELRTPLTLILGPLEDMVSDPAVPRQYAYKLQMMRDSSHSLLNLINSILEFRKTETQNRRLSVKRGQLSPLLREIMLRFKELNRNADLDFIIDIENDDPAIYFDAEMITIILNNLIGNAVKYTPKGCITLSYRTESLPDGSRRSVLRVEDTGFGIPKEGLPHIFERYYQVGGKHQASGTGLGLALVKNLVDLHKADIKVESQEGRGTVFTISMSTDETYNSEPTPTHRAAGAISEEAPVAVDAPLKLLVVEDNDDIREYVSQTLSTEFEVFTAHNGLEGLHMVQSQHPDMVISDIMMPEMDGVQMCRLIKDDILTSHIPVILLTAKDSILDKEEGYDAGADSYLTKPFSAKLLLGRIHNLLRSRRRLAAQLLSQAGGSLEPTIVHDTENNSDVTPDDAPEQTTATLNELDRVFLDKILEIITDNIALEELGVAFIADKMCMSSSTLYRKIMAIVGVSTNEYIRRVRMARAVELLMNSDMTINDIAFSTGFGSHSSFAKAFKKEFGMTASEYVAARKQ